MKKILLLVLGLLLFCSFVSAVDWSADLEPYFVDGWHLTGDTEGVKQYDGVVVGTPVPGGDKNGVADQAYTFDTGGYIQNADDPFETTGSFSACLWFNTTNVGSGNNRNMLTDSDADVSNENGFYFGHKTSGGDNKLQFFIFDGFTKGNIQVSLGTQNNVWYHLCGVYSESGTESHLYINGVLEGTDPDVDFDLSNAYNLTIGGCGPETAGSYDWNGSIDEVAFFNKSLSLGEVNYMYDHYDDWDYVDDTIDPIITSLELSDETPNEGDSISWTCNATDNMELDSGWCSWNDSGSWQDFNNTSLTGQNDTWNCENIVTASKGTTVDVRCHVKDAVGLQNMSRDDFTVVNAEPVVNLVSPSLGDPYRAVSFDYTYSVSDADGIEDVSYCELWKKNDTSFFLYNNTTEVSLTNYVEEIVRDNDTSTVNWTVKCYDSESAEGLSDYWIVYIDSKNPIPHFYYPKGDSSTNRSHSNDTFKLDVDVENDHLHYVNLTIFNPNNVKVHSNYSDELSDEEGIDHYNMSYSFDSPDWILGEYTVYVNATDYANNSEEWTVTFEVVNTPPTAPTLVNFTSPAVAYSDSVLVCEASGSEDAENDPIDYYYQFRDTDNSTELQGYSNDSTLDCGSVSGCDRGDTIYCYAFASDGLANSSEGPQDSIAIVNREPTHSTPLLTSSSGTNYTDEDLTCSNVSTNDADGDVVVNIFVWLRDNLPFNSLYLPFETLFIDYSGSGNAVNNNGATLTTGTTGKIGEGSYFDGADYIKVNDDTSIDFSSDKSWELWVKRSTTGTETLFDKSDSNTTNYKLEFDADNKLKFSYSIPDGEAGNYSWVTSTEENFSEGTHSDTVWDTDHVELNASKTSGTYTSKVFNATALASWNSIDWTEGLPYGEELPDNKGSDSGADMSNNKLLLHMDNDWEDSSGENNDGTGNGGVSFTTSSKFGSHAGNFDGIDDYVNLGNIANFDRTDPFSLEFWFKTTTISVDVLLDRYGSARGWSIYLSDGKLVFVLTSVEGNYIKKTTVNNYTDDAWHHAVLTYSGSGSASGVILYVDGDSVSMDINADSLTGTTTNNLDCSLGSRGESFYYEGLMDEAAIYTETLSSEEVLKHYKRGILELDLEVRSCSDVCDTEDYVDVTDNPPQDLTINNNNFFQYKFDFSTEDVSYTPELYNVTVDYTLLNGGAEASLTSNSSVTDTVNFHHVVVTFDDAGLDNFKLYLDNSLDAYTTETDLPDYKNNDLYIGKDFAGTSYFTGNLDEFRIYDHVLSSEQISNHFNLNYNILDSEETTRSNVYNCSITPTDGVDDGETKTSDSLIINNYPPTVPNLLTPSNYDVFGAFPTFTWSTSTDADPEDEVNYFILFDDNSDFIIPEYTFDTETLTSHDPVDGDALPNNIIDQYYWKIIATDDVENVSSSYRTFNYSQWNIEFNVTSSKQDEPELNNVDIGCDYTGFDQGGDTTNIYGPYGFPSGNWACSFAAFGYFNKTVSFTADNDKVIQVVMPEKGDMTYQEHTWLEAIYNCIVLKECDLYNLLLQINESAGNTWRHVKPTDESVIASETEISNTLSSTSNITYDYSVNIPIKAGYSLGAYLPVRIGFWFMDEANESCYSQGTLPTGVTVIEPYCNPLMVQTIGPMGGSVDFRVDLRPNLAAGTYNIKRIIEIDPNEVWEGYGQEIIDTITVTEDMIKECAVNLDKTGELMPDTSSSSSPSSGGGGGGSSVTNIYNTYEVTEIIEKVVEVEKESEDKEEKEQGDPWKYFRVIPAEKESGLSSITGAVVSGIKSNSGTIMALVMICIIIIGIGGYFYARSKKK